MAKRVKTIQPTYTLDPSGIIVVGSYPEHEAIIADCVEQGYGSDLSSRLRILIDTCSAALVRATNEKIPLVVHSYAGVQYRVTEASTAYKSGVLLAMPLGSNDKVELTALASVPCIVTTGASSNGAGCTTGYGNGLEFWDVHGASSNSNGVVAGKLLKIKETLNCTWWEARYRARQTANRTTITHLNGEQWNKYHGYGQILVDAAIAWTGIVPTDPYMTR